VKYRNRKLPHTLALYSHRAIASLDAIALNLYYSCACNLCVFRVIFRAVWALIVAFGGGVTLGAGLAMLAVNSSHRRKNYTLQSAGAASVVAGAGLCLFSWGLRFRLMPSLRKAVQAYNDADQLDGSWGLDSEGD
jgi:hypothetical protein